MKRIYKIHFFFVSKEDIKSTSLLRDVKVKHQFTQSLNIKVREKLRLSQLNNNNFKAT